MSNLIRIDTRWCYWSRKILPCASGTWEATEFYMICWDVDLWLLHSVQCVWSKRSGRGDVFNLKAYIFILALFGSCLGACISVCSLADVISLLRQPGLLVLHCWCNLYRQLCHQIMAWFWALWDLIRFSVCSCVGRDDKKVVCVNPQLTWWHAYGLRTN